MAKGMSMMLQSFGINPEKILEDFTNLRKGVEEILKRIEGRLDSIDAKEAQAIELQKQNTILLQELTAWKRILASTPELIQLLQRPTPQAPPSNGQIPQNQPPSLPSEQHNTPPHLPSM